MRISRFLNGALLVSGLGLSALGCGNAPDSLATAPGVVNRATASTLTATGRQLLSGHLTPEIMRAPIVGRTPPARVMTLTIGMPVRNLAKIQADALSVSDPSSPTYRQYITPSEFAARYGASPADYQAVLDWARSKNLSTVAHGNRLVAEVTGTVADLEAAFAVHFNDALRPDGTQFYAPDTEPSLDLAAPVDHIGNLENYVLPRPAGGSGPGGSRQGTDFRNAYASGTTMTGAGQSVGILMLDGFSQSDVNEYFASMSLPQPLAVQTVPAGTGTSVGLEGDLDVQMILSIAPGVQVVAFTGAVDSILSNMADATAIKQFTSSWFFAALDTQAQASVAQIALQGQSFFQASGDSGAYPPSYFASSGPDMRLEPTITVVGGTGLDMNGNGASYGTETAWSGSSGGIITYASGGGEPMPSYQVGLANSANQASTRYRNLPDVSAEATDVNIYLNGSPHQVQGTSAATPLWAGFTALANQLAQTLGNPTVGFANPALYVLAANSSTYAADFHDIQSGTNPANPAPSSGAISYTAMVGYDLVTGLGSPKVGLIAALAECTPFTLQQCGTIGPGGGPAYGPTSNGCGGTLDCPPCVPTATCASLDAVCATVDNCGNPLNCGTCEAGLTCEEGKCILNKQPPPPKCGKLAC